MRRRAAKRVTIPLSLAILLLLAGIVLASGSTPTVDWWVVGGGGGHVEASPYALDGTIGQGAVGEVSNSYELCSGFWCGAAEYRIYLPLVLRNWE